jgi:D-3-phosphoglycerate dehydrogenase
MAEERGIELTETGRGSEDFTELVTCALHAGGEAVEVAGTGVGPRNIPTWRGSGARSFYLPFADHLAIFRYTDQPGMIGRVGTMFGEEGVNIVSAAVGAEPGGTRAVMALTTDAPVNPGRSRRSSSSTASPSGARSSSKASCSEAPM